MPHALLLTPLMLPLILIAGALLHARYGHSSLGSKFSNASKELTPRQWVIGIAGLTCFFGFLYWIGQQQTAAQTDILRRQFLLSDDVTIAAVRRNKHPSVERPQVEAVVHFTRQQFRDYVRKLDEPVWRPGLLSYNGVRIESYSEEALRWGQLPRPVFVGDRLIRWGFISEKTADNVRNGRVFCFALQRIAVPAADGRSEPASRYLAKGCRELSRTDVSVLYVIGVIDFESKTLHMKIE